MKKTLLTSKTLAILVAATLTGTALNACKGEPTQSEQSQPGTQQSEQYNPPTQGTPGEPAQKDQAAKSQQQ
jgi:hypothetical protein